MKNEVRYFDVQMLDRSAIDEDARTIEMAFSSETPVERHFGNEVLDHSPESVDLNRLNDGAPLLLEHDRTQQIGVIESARVDSDRVGRAVVRFSQSALGQEIFQDVKDGIRRLVSVGYTVGEFAKEKAEAGLETLRAINWEPLEISLVAIPADSSVGVGRSEPKPTDNNSEQPKKIMEEKQIEKREAQTDQPIAEPAPEVRIEVRPDKRASEIAELGRKFDASERAIEFISEGKAVDDFKTHLMERAEKAQPIEPAQGDDEIGMSKRERGQYSLTNAILSSANGGLTGIELEASRELEKRFGTSAQGFYVPNDVFTRDLTASGGDTGDKLVATDKPFVIEALTAQPVVQQLGARLLSGLTSDVTIPKSGTGTAYWTAENAAATESTPTVGSITLSPKRVAAYSELSKQLLAQSNFDVEGMIRSDLLLQLNLAFDKVAIDGGGTSEPSGVLDASGLHGQTGGQTWQNMVDAEGDVLSTNALAGSLAYVSTPANMAAMKAADKGSDTGQFVWANNEINGYPAVATNQMTAATTVFGDWSQVILAEFGAGVDLVVDPYSLALTGLIRVHVARLVDVGVRHGAAFCKITA
jgi:HK97 family phage major capsid protein